MEELIRISKAVITYFVVVNHIDRLWWWLFSCSVLPNSFETPWTVARQAPLSIARQEYWSGLPFSSPGDLPDPWVRLAAKVFTIEPAGKPIDRLEPREVKRTNARQKEPSRPSPALPRGLSIRRLPCLLSPAPVLIYLSSCRSSESGYNSTPNGLLLIIQTISSSSAQPASLCSLSICDVPATCQPRGQSQDEKTGTQHLNWRTEPVTCLLFYSVKATDCYSPSQFPPPTPKFLKLYMVLAEVSAFGRLLTH